MPALTIPSITKIPAAPACLKVPAHFALVSDQLRWLRAILKLEHHEVSAVVERDQEVSATLRHIRVGCILIDVP